MRLETFWRDNFPRPADLPVADQFPDFGDVAVIGGGFTGLSAARTLARAGASVVVLEAQTIGWGASSRNGGITGCGLKRGAASVFKRYGEELGHQFWQASLGALDLIRELVEYEGIACDYHQSGDLLLAYKPAHFEQFKESIEWNRKVLGHNEQHLFSALELKNLIGSSAYFGGMLDEHGGGLHPAKLVYGLARVAAQYGAHLVENAPVEKLEKVEGGYLLQTPRGRLKVKEVVSATNGYTDRLVPGLKSRVIPVGSYIIVTEPLSKELQDEISPRRHTFYDAKWFLNYFRLTPDGRMLWGGRNNMSTSLDLLESARILQPQMVRAFPQLENATVTHSWTGQLGVTFDLMPHIGQVRGVHYALGFNGHGLHMALYTGREVAQLLTGEKASSPFAEIPHQTYPFYRNKTWFLPMAAWYYRLLDAVS